jgi:hypothetical protein
MVGSDELSPVRLSLYRPGCNSGSPLIFMRSSAIEFERTASVTLYTFMFGTCT